MTKEERAELRRLAEAAAHVEWWKAVDKIQDRAGLHESVDALIAAVNPTAVLALIDALDAKEAELVELNAPKNTVRTCGYCGHSPAVYSEGQCQQCGEPSK